MSDVFKADGGQKEQKGGANFRVRPRDWIIFSIFLGIILLMLIKDRMDEHGERISQYQFEELVESDQIARATVIYDQQGPLNEIVGTYYKSGSGRRIEVPFQTKVRLTGRLEERLLKSPQFEVRQPNTMLMSLVWSLLPILLIAALIWFFFIRQIRRVTKDSRSVMTDFHAKQNEQQVRFDKILDKWEQQANRMDAVLEKMERDPGVNK